MGKAHLHYPGIVRNADDWTFVSVSALYGASALKDYKRTLQNI